MSLIPTSLYIHFPWCIRKCPYCDFHSIAMSKIPEKTYIDALIKDFEHQLADTKPQELVSIFMGGGTPSLFSPASIKQLLDHIKSHINIAKKAEVTMEVNPGTIDQKHFADYRAAGVNRLSIGIQSFQDEKLKKLGRIHTSNEAKTAIWLAKKADFKNVNLDLMYGLPDQTVDEALFDLESAVAYQVQHISWYQLTIEPETPFGRHSPTLPDEDTILKMEHLGRRLLANSGYQRYEISAYAKKNFQCEHNLNYWQYGDYLAIGSGAHGKITKITNETPKIIKRYWKTKDIEDYLEGNFLAGQQMLNPKDVPLDFMMNALRLINGFSIRLYEERTGLSFNTLCPRIERAVNQGFLTRTDSDVIQLTTLGQQFLNECLQIF
ncbi:MAG: radical SAM family heme chaperone HemW [Gammaproteobacteria bacterium]|nr:radical SAM family heme chaperone HemW [Gammaproteobacteria bacterium]